MAEEFKVLSDIEHILKRPAMYIGSCTSEESQRFIDGKLQSVHVVPGLLKIVNEIIDNSVDEFIRSKEKYANKINITIDEESFTVEDNGRGIPVEKYENEWRPKLSWCAARAGTSFSDNRESPGANGVGSMITNCFSSEFIGETYDGKKYCKVHCENNISKIKVSISATTAKGTRVTSFPDFKRFGITEFTNDHILLLKERINTIAASYNKIKFTFNNEQIVFKNAKQYLEKFGDTYVLTEFNNGYFGIFPTEYDEYVQKSSINGLELIFGGTHESYIMRELSYSLRDLIKKKHKLDLSPAEIKRCLKLVFIGRSFPNMEFESQTKEKLSNSEKSVKEWLGNIDFDKLAKKVFAEQNIIEPIIQAKLAKQMAADARAVTLAQKKMNKTKVHKHVAAKSKNRKNTVLFLTEGDSAAGGIVKIRNPEIHGVFPLRGNPLNVYGMKPKDILANKEISNIFSILGINFGMSDKELLASLTYDKIGILCDSDADGLGIVSPLLMNVFNLFPVLYKEKKIYSIISPLYIYTKGKGASRKVVYIYSQEEYEKTKDKYKNYELRYIKGLGSLRDYELQYVLENESMWEQIELDKPESFDIMFSDDVQARRNIIGF